jgi:hypothetical protein
MGMGLRLWGAGLVLVCGLPGYGQTLARRHWEGSGITTLPWWDRAVFCRIDLRGRSDGMTLPKVSGELDRVQAMGCQALELGVLTAGGSGPIEAKYGSMDDADGLIDELARRRVRLVLDMPVGQAMHGAAAQVEQDLTARMRLWLTRGVAGFVLEGGGGDATAADMELLKRLRKVTDGVIGTRVLIGDGLGLGSTGERGSADVAMVVRRVEGVGDSAGVLRARLAGVASGLGGRAALLAARGEVAGGPKVEAAILLLSGTAAELPAGPVEVQAVEEERQFSADELLLWVPKSAVAAQTASRRAEAGDELTRWYGTLNDLHGGNAALRSGDAVYLNHDAEGVLAWVVRAKGAVAPVVVVCNLTGQAVKVSLAADVRGLGVKGQYLKALARTGAEPKTPATLGAVAVEGSGVFVGEIR